MPRNLLRPGLRLLGVLAVILLAVACSDVSNLISRRQSIAKLVDRAPSPGQTVELDAFFSGAGRTSPTGSKAASGTVDPGAILSDRPFLAELSVLGKSEANSPPTDEPWLVAVPGPNGPALSELPYDARFRGHLQEPSPAVTGATAAQVFVVEQVVRVRAQRPPEPAQVAGDAGSWSRYQVAEGGYSVPQPPKWRVEQPDPLTLLLHAPQWPDYPVVVRVHPGETHHDPYDPTTMPPLLLGRQWSVFEQAKALSQSGVEAQGLAGYRLEGSVGSDERLATVLYSGNGKTYEVSVRYPLGFDAPQPLLSAYSAIVAGFRFDTAPGPTPTPPVRQALGAGPFLEQDQALRAACDRCGQQIDSVEAQLVSEAEARRLAGDCSAFTGHLDGVWVLTMSTPAATRTHNLRLFLDATTGRELCREEIRGTTGPGEEAPPAQLLPGSPVAAIPGSRKRIEVNLAQQTLTAYENDMPVRQMLICSGVAQYPTVTGEFRIYRKTLSMTMTGPGYSIPAVPHVMLFHEGYAIHGAYWRSVFGFPASHGCVNVSLSDAIWLFDWTAPQLPDDVWSLDSTICNPGTLVVVH